MSTRDIAQPMPRGGSIAGVPKYNRGGPRSVARLKNLNFDPIGELVAKYKKLEEEIQYQEKLRSNSIVELNANGRPRAYRAEQHYALYDKLITISDKLLRYNYGRVPELVEEQQKVPMPLIVNLTKKGDKYVVNEEDEQPDGVIEDYEDDSDRS
jgi:hypothetical protein